jgi:hypothetical protein
MSIHVGARTLTLAQATHELTTHLKAIVQVELFTIPVYLTAVYSFSARGLSWVDPHAKKDGDRQPLFSMQQKALSVAVQEMLHLQLACNLVNALGATPDIPALNFDSDKITIPHLMKNGEPQTMSLGNLAQTIDAFIGIEAPDPAATFPPPNAEAKYSSISDLYHATLELLGLVAGYPTDTPIFNDENQVAYGTFPVTYPGMPMRVTSPETAVTAANAIADQGEGQMVSENQPAYAARRLALYVFGRKGENNDGNVAPPFRPELASRFGQWGNWAHYSRFEQIRATLHSPEFERWNAAARDLYEREGYNGTDAFYRRHSLATNDLPPAPKPTLEQLNDSNNVIWTWITEQLRGGFKDGALSPSYSTDEEAPNFTEAMLSFKYVLPMIWCYGQVPAFTTQDSVKGEQVQKAMDVVDPYCLFHWDEKTRRYRTLPFFKQNACHGLNSCEAMGWGGFGTKAGDGACASADPHTCGGNNDCSGRGGCGFLVGPSGESCSAGRKQQQTLHARRVLRGGEGPQTLCGGPAPARLLAPCEEWIPGMNGCAIRGGCETPISTEQKFSSAAKKSIEEQGPHGGWTKEARQALLDRAGTPVWDYARTLLKNAYGDLGEPSGTKTEQDSAVIYDGKVRRTLIKPTSPS